MNNRMRQRYQKMRTVLMRQGRLHAGFTLVETLVAITILLVAIMGPMTIAARGLQSAFHAREQITAFFLAQEGVELIRMHRDGNALGRLGWLNNIPGVCRSNSQGCGMDARNPAVIRNCNSENCQLSYDTNPLSSGRGFYTYTPTGLPSMSPFTRQIWVNPLGGGGEAVVTVTVSWPSGLFGGTRNVTVTSRIFNQYDNL